MRLLCAMNVKEGFDVAKTLRERCCTRDGGGPPVAALQGEAANHRKLRRSRAGVVSVAGKGPLTAGQVGDEKTNVREPLLTHR